MTDLPADLDATLAELLGSRRFDVYRLGAGVARVSAHSDAAVVKWSLSDDVPSGWPTPVTAEVHGLRTLAAAGAVRVPAVRHWQAATATTPECLVLDWIDASKQADQATAGERLGHELAQLHQHRAQRFGLEQHNYCGATPQPNHPSTSWLEFFREQRLRFQGERAISRGHMPPQRAARLERLLDRLHEWIDDATVRPSLLHGDLWSGNWLVAVDGAPVLIDPAISYGDAEFDLAMCRLFGGFPRSFYAAYDEAQPPRPGRDGRLPLYQLYHLLNHLNLFGEGYGSQVDAVLRRYGG